MIPTNLVAQCMRFSKNTPIQVLRRVRGTRRGREGGETRRRKRRLSTKMTYLLISSLVTMQISKGPESLVSFTIGKIAYQLGETVSGTFDFSKSAVPCYQVFPFPRLFFCSFFLFLPFASSTISIVLTPFTDFGTSGIRRSCRSIYFKI